MNFYVDSGGAILGVDPEKIYQGSANANTIRFVGAFASNVKVTVAFKLPTGVWTTPQLMTASTQLAGVVTSNGVQFNVWEYSIPALVTETFGTVNMQFYVYGDAGNGNGGLIATASSSFQVERGVPITLPDPTDDYKTLLTQILSALSQIEGQIPGMEEDITGLQSKVSDLSEDKLDKQSGATAYEEAYVKDTDGSQKMERVTITSIASAIVKRDANGNINIAKGLSGNPKNGANMENIADVEEKISKCPTLAGDNDFTGINRFIIPITIGTKAFPEISIGYTSMTWRTDANTFYTYSYPTKSGTFAFTSDIPTDYATQTALANTQRQVDGLYTLLEQKNEIYVQTATDTYTTRETAGGENIADGVQTPVKKITGKTVKTTNLIRRPYVSTTSSILGVKCTVNDDGSITFNGTATGVVNFVLYNINDCYLSEGTYTFKLYGGIQSEIYFVTGGAGSTVPIEYGDRTITLEEGTAIGNFNIQIPTGTVVNNVTVYPMLNEGSTALPYMPYFSGLKNAFFKEIVSTGRNLIPYPYADKTKTINGITFTVNNDGTINVNGTATELTTFWLFNKSKNLPLGMSVGKMYTISLKGGSDNCYIYTNYIDSAGEAHGAGLSSNTGNTPTNTVGEEWKGLQIYIVVTQGTALNNVTVYPMLNYGSSALPYEPYTQSVLSLPEAVENGEWNTIDIENGKNILQGFTKTFDGTEDIQRTFKTYDYGGYPVLSMITNPYSYNDNATVNLITGIFNNVSAQSLITNKEEGICTYGEGGIRYFLFRINPIIYGCTMDSTDDELIAGFKAYLAAQHTAGNPLVVRYKTEEIQSETDISPSADSYIAWKNGSETIEQGDTDNSIYGAENTVDQDYYLLTAPEEVTKE